MNIETASAPERINTAIQTDESNLGEEQNQEALDLGGGLKVQTI